MIPLISLREKIDSLLTVRKMASISMKAEEILLMRTEEKIQGITTAQQTLQALAEQVQEKAHKGISKVVSKCLSAVFNEPYQLRIQLERKRGRTEAEFVYLRNGRKISPRITSGGVRDVTALSLRLASLSVSLPPKERLLVLDEPFGALDQSNREKIAVLLSTLVKGLGVQFVLVTHDSALRVGKVMSISPSTATRSRVQAPPEA